MPPPISDGPDFVFTYPLDFASDSVFERLRDEDYGKLLISLISRTGRDFPSIAFDSAFMYVIVSI